MIRTRVIGESELWYKAIVYGPFGVGKTLFAASAGKHKAMAPVLMVNIEGGGVTASNMPNVRETEQLSQFSDVHEVFWNLANGTEEDGEDWGQYNTVIVDSGSALQDMNIIEVAASNATGKKSATRVSQQDWGDSTRMVAEILRRFRSLPMHVIVTAGQRELFPVEEESKQAMVDPVKIRPDFTPSLSRKIAHMFDHVWAMTSDENGTRFLLTQRNGVYEAKTRGREFAEAIGDVVESPSLPDIFDTFLRTQTKGKKK